MGSKKYWNIFVSKSCYELISEYIRIQKVDTNEYPNIFVSKKLTRTNIRIYSYPKNDTNKHPNKYLDQISNIQIYSSHSDSDSKTISIIVFATTSFRVASWKWVKSIAFQKLVGNRFWLEH